MVLKAIFPSASGLKKKGGGALIRGGGAKYREYGISHPNLLTPLSYPQDWRLNQIAGGKKLHVVLGSQLVAPNLRLAAKSLKIRVKGFSSEKERNIAFQWR